ncbi:hypothetical protein K469DRAFT_740096 [Zopfia rhizophila CBS 207.26]|uniref:Uncharacterized protein n=1 Tax=Zopfia rhizophila CBS 207.26 TaxID=1314779 RepID=A0A6A6DX12_9PEZI|nr:hypothetical protein K469DRAFT_740096 [Zopfia rhizophila CBS 207.26]
MAINLKRKRAAISYKEPDTDDELSENSDEGYTPKKKHAVPQRRSARHSAQAPEEPSLRQSRRSGPNREPIAADDSENARPRRKRVISYRESSSDEDEDTDFQVEEEIPAREKPKGKVGRPPRTQSKKSKLGRPKRTLGAPRNRRSTPKPSTDTSPPDIISDGNKPAWSSLPYHILLQIFVYASHPLHENLNPTSSIPWLVAVSRMCLSFTKPALTALYRNPPIFAIKKNRKDLVHHLTSPPSNAHEDYPVMVKRLELDVTKMSTLTDPTHSVADLASLVASLTTLREMDIFDPIDRPPYRSRTRVARWKYPDELFAALHRSELRLRSWRWNATFCSHGLLWMKEIHTDNAFQNLRELLLTKYHSDSSYNGEDGNPIAEELLGSALAVLPNLNSLVFETCTIVNERLLPLLPSDLVILNFSNCKDLKSDTLQAFLVTHGGQLKDLVLNHNQSLDLSFLVDLKQSCPRLEVFRVDLNYYNSFSTSHDSDPNYDELLKEGEIPSWPASLRIIEMEYLRHWTPTAAKAFFSSLIDSAEELPYLRELAISTMVDIDWRERAAFRSEWTSRFQKVFAQKSTPPNPHLVSLRAFREWKSGQVPDQEKNDSFIEENSDEVKDGEDSDAPLLPAGRKSRSNEKWDSKRLRSRARPSSSHGEASGDDSHDNACESDSEKVAFVQGRCSKVVFRIDNFRPREEVFDEADFLDTEASGDEDWNGNDDADEGGYAW